jgi:hypothetical protein
MTSQYARHNQRPSRLNLVSLLITVGGVAAIYGVVRFGPALYTRWEVKRVLDDACAHMYKLRNLQPNDHQVALNKLHAAVVKEITNLGVTDPEMTVEFDDTTEPPMLYARAAYSVVVSHPWGGEPTVLEMHPAAAMDGTPPDWDK